MALMKPLPSLIFANAALLLAIGLGVAFSPPLPLPVAQTVGGDAQTLALVHLLAAALAGLAFVVLMQSRIALAGELRRLAFALGVADGLIFLATLFEHGPLSVAQPVVFLNAYFFALSAMLLGLGLGRRVRPEEIAAEIADLKLPDEIRQGLLQQIGEAAAQEERNRLARDLHDSIKQQLFSINVGTATAQERWEGDPQGAREALADVRRSAREAMVEMQAMLHQLRPEALGTAGLIEALREQCEALGYRTGAKIELELGEPAPDDRLPPGAQEALFRLGQEMLANVARHARARHVRLWLGRQEDAVRLCVEDDGQGFDPAAGAPGMGLRNLRERAASLGGKLKMDSAPGAGTRAEVLIPLTPAAVAGESRIVKETQGLIMAWLIAAPWCFQQVVNGSGSHPRALFVPNLDYGALGLIGINAAASWWTVQKGLRRSPAARPAEVARLRYFGHLGRAVLFVAGAGIALRNSASYRGEYEFWRFCAYLFPVLVALEIFHAYRWSRPRRRLFEGWAWPSRWGWPSRRLLTLMVAFLSIELGLGVAESLLSGKKLWTSPPWLQFLALAAVVLAYFLWRRPLTAEDQLEPELEEAR
jgi:signal transduction histidine kinase